MTSHYTRKSLMFDILSRKQAGLSCTEIARQVSCSVSNVSQVLKRHAARDFRVSPLPADKLIWIEREARKHEVTVAEMARAMLLDSIEEAMEGKFQ